MQWSHRRVEENVKKIAQKMTVSYPFNFAAQTETAGFSGVKLKAREELGIRAYYGVLFNLLCFFAGLISTSIELSF